MPQKFKIKKGDRVEVISGPDKGTRGDVVNVIREKNRVVVEGVNTRKRHTKASYTSAGGIESFDAPIHISNVALIDPKEDKPTRVGYKTLKDGKKVRVARRSGEVLDG